MYREQEVDMSKKHILKMSLLVLFLFGFWEIVRDARAVCGKVRLKARRW